MRSGIRWAKVVGVKPGAHSVDLVFQDTGERIPGVAVLAAGCSTNTGMVDLPTPTAPPQPYSTRETGDRDVYAVVLVINGSPVVVGFKFPEVCQMTFLDPDLKITRHASDVYSIVDGDGNSEWFHPSGTYFRVGTSPAHRDLTGMDVDKLWAITKNTAAAVHVHLSVANGGAEVASADFAPDGTITTMGSMWTHTGPIKVVGDLHSTGTITGDVDVLAAGKSGNGHTHIAHGSGSPTDPPT